MATFYNPTASAPMPNFIGYSRGVRPDNSLGIALEGLADIGQTAISGVDTLIKQDIQRTTDAQQTANREEYLGTLLGQQPAQEQTQTTVPPGVAKEVSSQARVLNNMSAQRDAGVLNEAMFYMRAKDIASGLRAKYPGYKDYIDRVTTGVLGVDPANAAINRLEALQQLRLTRAEKEKDDRQKFIDTNAGLFGGPNSPSYQQAVQAMQTPDGEMRIREFVSKQKNIAHRREEQKAVIESLLQQRKLDADTAEGMLVHTVNDISQQVWSGAIFSAGGMGLNDITSTLANINPKNIKDPAQIDRLHGHMNNLIIAYDAAILQAANAKYSTGDSLASIIKDQGKITAAAKPFRDLLVSMRDQLGKDHDQFSRLANLTEAMTKSNELRIIAQVPEMAEMIAIIKAGGLAGKELYDYYRTLVPEGARNFGNIQENLKNLKLQQYIITGQGNLVDAVEQAKRISREQTPQGGAAADKPVVKSVKEQAAALRKAVQEGPPEARANVAKVLSNSKSADFVQIWQPEQRVDAWAMLSDKATATALAASSPETRAAYKSWNDRTALSLFSDHVRSVQKYRELLDPRFNIRYNPETSQIDYDPIPQVGPRTSSRPAIFNTIDQLNKVLAVKRGISEAYGEDPNKAIHDMLKFGGLDFGKEVEPSTAISDWIKSWIPADRRRTPQLFQNTPRSPQDGRTGALGGGAVQLASLGNNAPTGNLGANRARLLDFNADLFSAVTGTNPLSNVIGRAESGGGNYNIVAGGGRHNLTGMTVAQVQSLQKDLVASGNESSAVGKYQVVRETLNRAIKNLGIDKNAMFDEATQERIGDYLIRQEAGGDKYLAGDISKKTFADRLAKVWAGLPLASGASAYAGVGSNRATVSREAVMRAIDQWTASQNSNTPTDISGQSRRSDTSDQMYFRGLNGEDMWLLPGDTNPVVIKNQREGLEGQMHSIGPNGEDMWITPGSDNPVVIPKKDRRSSLPGPGQAALDTMTRLSGIRQEAEGSPPTPTIPPPRPTGR